MTPFGQKLAGIALASTALAGCAVFASKSEYHVYREIHTTEDEHAQLSAMHTYMVEYPTGTWSAEIQAKRVEVEPRIWEEVRSSREGLEFYLDAFPDGPHAAEAQPRLAALTTVAGRREQEEEAARETERQRREAILERQRLWLSRATGYWTRTLIGITNWGSPIPEVARRNPSFSHAFGGNPPPRCSRTECIKFYSAAYSIPVPGSTRIERQVDMYLRLRLNDGRLVRAEMLLPNKGFSRWYEQENRTIVVDEDPEQRQQAIEWALAQIVPAIREVAPSAHNLDVVPEPIDPPTVRAPNQPDVGSSLAPGDEPEHSEEAPTPAPTPTPAPDEHPEHPAPQQPPQQGGGDGIDQLLRQASGDEATPEPTPTPTPEPTPMPTAEPEEMVLPIALQGFTAGGLRIVLFAAGDEDYGSAYDGLFIEFEAPEPATPTGRGHRRRGRHR